MRTRRTYRRIVVLSVVLLLAAVVPQQILAQTQKGIELYNDWKFAEAERVLSAAVKANPADLPANYYLGLSLLLQDKHSQALDAFLNVKLIRDKAEPRTRPAVPSEYQVQMALARAHLELKQLDQAWKNLEAARAEDSQAADVYVYRGQYYFLQSKNSEAIKELEKAIKLDDKNPYAYYFLGLTYHQAGQASKAVDALKMFLQLDPHAPEAGSAKKLVDQLC